jgi:hypothetical protein
VQGDLQEQESIGLYFSIGCSGFFVFFNLLYQNFAKIQPKKKKKKSQFYTRRTNSKILPISVSKDSEISPEKKKKKNTGWVQYFLFSQFYYLA